MGGGKRLNSIQRTPTVVIMSTSNDFLKFGLRCTLFSPFFKMPPGQHGAQDTGHIGQPAIELEDVYARSEDEPEGEARRAGGVVLGAGELNMGMIFSDFWRVAGKPFRPEAKPKVADREGG